MTEYSAAIGNEEKHPLGIRFARAKSGMGK